MISKRQFKQILDQEESIKNAFIDFYNRLAEG